MFLNILMVGAGGFIGSVARYLVSVFVRSAYPSQFPLGTLVANVVGCFSIGFFSAYAEKHYPAHALSLLFLTTGVMGGFTTFSAFGLETIGLIRGQQLMLAIFNVLLSLILGLGAVWIGRSIP